MKPDLPAGLRKISLTCLAPSPFNARRLRTEAQVAGIARSLAEDGQREPITVYPGAGEQAGRYLIVSGVTRYLAALSLGWKTLEAREDATLDPANALLLTRVSHLHNDTHRETELDHAYVARTLRQAGHPVEAIARALGYGTKRNVSRWKAFFELPERVLELGKTQPEKFSARLAELLKKAVQVIEEEKALTLLKRAFAEELSLREVERLIRAEEKNLGVKPRPWQTQALEIRVRGEKIGRLDVWQTPEKEYEFRFSALLDQAMGERMSEQLTELFKRFMEEAEEEEGGEQAG
jgi:ParB family chromosome partitioning protein